MTTAQEEAQAPPGALVRHEAAPVPAVPMDPTILHQVIIGGDLARLTQTQQLDYYNAVCVAAGVNPATRPFEYLKLNNRLVLYARKDCTEQLRVRHGVSVVEMRGDHIGDVYVVTVKGQNAQGRTDMATGAVTTKNLAGDALANALMKAETKAKRRLTLSICGLGMLDETEIETIPSAMPASLPTAATPAEVENQPAPAPREANGVNGFRNEMMSWLETLAKGAMKGTKEYLCEVASDVLKREVTRPIFTADEVVLIHARLGELMRQREERLQQDRAAEEGQEPAEDLFDAPKPQDAPQSTPTAAGPTTQAEAPAATGAPAPAAVAPVPDKCPESVREMRADIKAMVARIAEEADAKADEVYADAYKQATGIDKPPGVLLVADQARETWAVLHEQLTQLLRV